MIAHDIRSAHNVGALFRTAEGLGVQKVYCTGYTPYPITPDDERLPHLARKIDNQIQKTALGAQTSLRWEHSSDVITLIANLKDKGYEVIGLEQHKKSMPLNKYEPPKKLAILLGREVEGIDKELLELCDDIVVIPMFGKKESFNVVEAATMALYHCRFFEL